MAPVVYDLSACDCCIEYIECSSFPGEPINPTLEVEVSVCGSTPITGTATFGSHTGPDGPNGGWQWDTSGASDPAWFPCGDSDGPGWEVYFPTLYCMDTEGVVYPDIGGNFYETGASGTPTCGGTSIAEDYLIGYTVDSVDPLQITATYDLYGYLTGSSGGVNCGYSTTQADDILSACGCPTGGPATLTVVWREP